MEDFRQRSPKKHIQKKLRQVSVYAVIMTVLTFVAAAMLVLLGFSYSSLLKTMREQNEMISEITGENKSMAESMQELEQANDNLSESNERLSEDVDFFSRIMSENELRLEIIDLFEAKNSTYNVLKKIYPDKLILLDSGQFNFYDINRDLNKCEYEQEYFIYNEEKNEMAYAPGGEDISVKGIDVSKYNGNIEWDKVKEHGVEFAYIRAGVRGYVSGEIVKDDTFDDNIDAAAEAGLDIGVYIFSQAASEEEGRQEADFILENIEGRDINCPIVIDIEKIDNPDTEPRTLNLSQQERTDIAVAFCERIREEGYTPMIYGNLYTFLKLLDMTRLEDYDKWFADYISEDDITPYFAYKFRVWQYLSDAQCPGISGKCDMNMALY